MHDLQNCYGVIGKMKLELVIIKTAYFRFIVFIVYADVGKKKTLLN